MDLSKIQITKEALKTYLYNVGVLEVAKSRFDSNEETLRDTLQKKEEAVAAQPREPDVPLYEAFQPMPSGQAIFRLITGAVIGFLLGLLVLLPVSYIFTKVYINDMAGILIVLGIMGIGTVGGGFLRYHAFSSAYKYRNWRIQDQNAKKAARYTQKMQEHHQTKQRLESEKNQASAALSAYLDKTASGKQRVEEELKKEYALDILPEKYRQLEAVLVMYNLLDTGRCDTLREALLAYDDFVWKMEDAQWKKAVTEQLSTIRQNQQKLFSGLEMLEEQTNAVSRMMKSGFQQAQANFAQIESQQQIMEGNVRTVRLLQDIHFWDTVT